jgi:hypothetical protein
VTAGLPVVVPVDVTDPARIAKRALHRLGRTHQSVAASLGAAGCTGFPGSPGSCPVARYLCASDPRITGLFVDAGEIWIDVPGESVRLTPPEPVSTFVVRFDTGAYPQLIASSLPSYPVAPGTTARQEDRQ